MTSNGAPTQSTLSKSLPRKLCNRVARDVAIIAGAVVLVAAVVVLAVLCWGIGGVIGITVATVVVGAVKEICAVLKLRYAQAVESLQTLVELEKKVGRLEGALKRLGLGAGQRDTDEVSQSKADEAERMKKEAAELIAVFDRRGALLPSGRPPRASLSGCWG
ncbi:hypothetical protein, partial [Microbacterium sp. B24]|uniref:hypothetical protein n=1 Tax=Microbacterium sp. B24 TaxID=95616 RepID=UPI0011D28E4E